MEVQIKKAKITKSLLNQVTLIGLKDFQFGKVLGWCYHNRDKTVVFFNSRTNLLSTFPYYEYSEFRDTNENGVVTGRFYAAFGYKNDLRRYFSFELEEDARLYIMRADTAVKNAKLLGQFYV